MERPNFSRVRANSESTFSDASPQLSRVRSYSSNSESRSPSSNNSSKLSIKYKAYTMDYKLKVVGECSGSTELNPAWSSLNLLGLPLITLNEDSLEEENEEEQEEEEVRIAQTQNNNRRKRCRTLGLRNTIGEPFKKQNMTDLNFNFSNLLT